MDTPGLGECLFDVLEFVCFGEGWGDTLGGKESIGVEGLEEVYSFLEVGNDFLLRGVVVIAAWLQSADAGSVLVPLMAPEVFIISLVVFPVFVHIFKGVGLAGSGEDSRNVGVFTAGIAILLI